MDSDSVKRGGVRSRGWGRGRYIYCSLDRDAWIPLPFYQVIIWKSHRFATIVPTQLVYTK